MKQAELFADTTPLAATWRCDCGGTITSHRTSEFYEDDWACGECTRRGVVSWSRVFGERAQEARRDT